MAGSLRLSGNQFQLPYRRAGDKNGPPTITAEINTIHRANCRDG